MMGNGVVDHIVGQCVGQCLVEICVKPIVAAIPPPVRVALAILICGGCVVFGALGCANVHPFQGMGRDLAIIMIVMGAGGLVLASLFILPKCVRSRPVGA